MNTSDMTRIEKCRHCMPDLRNKRVTKVKNHIKGWQEYFK